MKGCEQSDSCIMPESPYCPLCRYGLIIYPEDTMPGEEDVFTEWRCLYDPERDGDMKDDADH